MKTIKRLLTPYCYWMYAVGLAVLLSITGCIEEDIPFIELDKDQIEVKTNASKYTIDVKSNITWKAISDQSWCKIISAEGAYKGIIELSIDSNPTIEERTALLTVSSYDGTVQSTLMIRQQPLATELHVLEERVVFGKLADSRKIGVLSNYDWKVLCSVDWCNVTPKTKSGSGEIEIAVKENTSGKERSAEISLICEVGVQHPIIRTIEVIQGAEEFFFVVPMKKYELTTEENYIELSYQTSGDDVDIIPQSNVDWIYFERDPGPLMESRASTEDNYILAIVERNTATTPREGVVTLSASHNGGKPIVEEIVISQHGTTNTIDVYVDEVLLNGDGNRTTIVYNTNAVLELQNSYDWIKSEILDDQSIAIWADPNISGKERTGVVSIIGKENAMNSAGDPVAAVVKVKQSSLPTIFEFAEQTYTYSYHEATAYVSIISTGDWEVDPNLALPKWLKITPSSGSGNSTIQVSFASNKFTEARTIQVLFNNTTLNKVCVLNLIQEGDPAGLKDFSHLGKGYDVSGRYAYDEDVRAAVLSWQKLYKANHIADVINTNHTSETNIYGNTREEYVKAYTVEAGVSGAYAGFTAGISTNFSESSLSSSEHSFGTFRHMTKKQIIKLYDNTNAKQIMDCRSDMFIEDLNRLSAKDLVTKYGTHVITGLSLGGVLEYSMTANTHVTGSSVDFGLAVEAGFEMAGFGATASTGFQDFQSMQNEESQFESKLTCRGGESQFASTGVPGDDGKSTYNEWLNSLQDRNGWVMVDYEGALIPLWNFIEDKSKAAEVEAYVRAVLSGEGLPDIQTDMKRFNFFIDRVESDMWDELTTEWDTEYAWHIKTKMDGSQERTLWDAGYIGQDSWILLYWEPEPVRLFAYNGTHGLEFPYVISAKSKHEFEINFTGIVELDDSSENDPFQDIHYKLTYNPGKNTWTDSQGIECRDGETFRLVSKYDYEGYTEFIRFYCRIEWR